VTINVSEERTASNFQVDDAGSMFLQNINNHPAEYMVLQSRGSQPELITAKTSNLHIWNLLTTYSSLDLRAGDK
jgi:hypothetical protein